MNKHAWIGAVMAAGAALVLAQVAHAGEGMMGDPVKGRQIYFEGKGDEVPACASCHGEDGLGSDDIGAPRLAYQVSTYELKQLMDFRTDKRVDNTAFQMNDIAKALTDEDIRNVVAFVHTLKTPFFGSDLDGLRENGVEVGNVARGWKIVNFGIPERGVPACKSCHGFNGRSAGRIFPAIVGQRYTYIKHELEAFRLGATTPHTQDENARDNDPMAMMRKVASKLTDDDIKDAAAFLTQAPPATPGNPRTPKRP